MKNVGVFLSEAMDVTDSELCLLVQNIKHDNKKLVSYDLVIAINDENNIQTPDLEWKKVVDYFVRAIGRSNLDREISRMYRPGAILWTEIYKDGSAYYVDHNGAYKLPNKIKF